MTLLWISLLAASTQALLFERVRAPRGWSLAASPVPSPDHRITLELGLHQPLQDDLEARLLEVSDPDHADYGRHLSLPELEAYTRPTNDSIATVASWLDEHAAVESYSFSPSASSVTVRLPVHAAEQLLGTSFRLFEHESGRQLLRTLETHLPDHVHPHIAVMAPTTYFNRMHGEASQVHAAPHASQGNQRMASAAAAPAARAAACPAGACSNKVMAACDPMNITPACLQAVYNINYTPKVPQLQTIGVTGYLGQYFNFKDLDLFEELYSPQTAAANYSVVLINRGKNPQGLYQAGIEAGLDMQFASALSFPISSTFFSTGGSPPFKPDKNIVDNDNEPYLAFLNYILAQKTVPAVLSTSYGEDEQTVPLSFAKRVCSLYAQLGARGVSVLHASGDGGVTGSTVNGYCEANDGKKTVRMLPTFPASCPYVTAVGATQPSTKLGFAEEVVSPYSSGGFSDYFKRPSWQAAHVTNYLKQSKVEETFANLFSSTGRAYPDISLLGTYYAIVLSGGREQVYGTSCSTPAFASIITLLNDKRLAAGKPVLGFLNPWLYKTGRSAFRPVTVGSNAGCGTSLDCKNTRCKYKGKPLPGYPAMTPWSPGAGLGTPNFNTLLSLA